MPDLLLLLYSLLPLVLSPTLPLLRNASATVAAPVMIAAAFAIAAAAAAVAVSRLLLRSGLKKERPVFLGSDLHGASSAAASM